MIVVSGCPRSGTSLMMDLFRVALGDERIIGSKFPQLKESEDENIQACLDYIKDKQDPKWKENLEHSNKMNPNGFWECKWSVKGIQWEPKSPDNNQVVKIVSQGLAQSNPQYIDKVILMVRHPWSVANSHKDLVTQIPIRSTNKDIGNINPRMYIGVTYALCKWILEFDPSLLIVDFDELVSDPNSSLDKISDFIGEGDWDKAKKQIEPKLRRNEPKRLDDSSSWDLSLAMHEKFKEGDWQGVIDVVDEFRKNDTTEQKVSFHCPRWGTQTNNDRCRSCKTDKEFLANIKGSAISRKIDWKKEPCLWDCGMNPAENYTPLTFEQSIKHNHWSNNMKVKLIPKQDKPDDEYQKNVIDKSVGETDEDYILPEDTFKQLDSKYKAPQILPKEKVVIKKAEKKKCSSCSRAKRK